MRKRLRTGYSNELAGPTHTGESVPTPAQAQATAKTYMGVYSYKSGGGGGRKDKVFLKEILGRIRNFGEKCLFLGYILPILVWF